MDVALMATVAEAIVAIPIQNLLFISLLIRLDYVDSNKCQTGSESERLVLWKWPL